LISKPRITRITKPQITQITRKPRTDTGVSRNLQGKHK